jgi:hypothetical protein
MARCPGQDMRYWTPADIFYVNCPYCDYSIEFWKDEPFRLCRSCKKEVRNPRIDLGCAKWCKFGDQCLGRSANEQLAAAPVIEKLKALIEPLADYELFLEIERIASLLLTAEGGDPCRIKTGALLVGAVRNESDPAGAARAMLSKTILGAEETEAVALLVQQVLSDEKPASIDVSVVRDALILAMPDLNRDQDFQQLSTEGAQMIFNLRRKKKEESR